MLPEAKDEEASWRALLDGIAPAGAGLLAASQCGALEYVRAALVALPAPERRRIRGALAQAQGEAPSATGLAAMLAARAPEVFARVRRWTFEALYVPSSAGVVPPAWRALGLP